MKSETLLSWFENSARPFLLRHAKDRVPTLDNDFERLKRLLKSPEDVTVCFLGNSGIGKSTLLNALAAGAEQVLPSGGIGPLTAQATEVHFSETPSFRVIYHPRKFLWNLAFALEQRLVHQLKAEKKARGESEDPVSVEDDIAGELSDEERKEAIAIAGIAAAPEESGEDHADALVKQARQIVTGNQFSDAPLPYLVDALRVACDVKPRWQQMLDASDAKRLSRVKQVLQLAKDHRTFERTQGTDPGHFKEELHDHAAGFLSPLIERIYVGWPSEVLKAGVILVDLPGVGIAQDAYRDITKHYVREKARAVVLVVDRAGPTESTVELLRNSGYWDRLVGATDDPSADPCSMLMAVTRVDDVAQEEWRNWNPASGGSKPKKREIFERLIEEFSPRMKKQITEQLGKIGESTNEVVQTARSQARHEILQSLEIHPVSAPELRKLLLDDEEDRSFLQEIDQTGVPLLQESLIQLAAKERESRRLRIEEVGLRLAGSTVSELQIIDGQWRQQGRADQEAERLDAALQEILEPKRKEYDRRVGAFREFLDETIQAKIEALVLEARGVAETEVNGNLRGLRGAHWMTLRAAVLRGGAYHGSRVINLPDDISSYFQEPMAAVWGQRLLKDVRQRTKQLADDIEQMVAEICAWANSWAKDNSGTGVNKKLLESQQERVASMAAQMKQVGKEAVDELRETVKSRLTAVIRKPIKAACEKFVKDGDHQGAGTKARILELFSQLAHEATSAAKKPAESILQSNFAKVRGEIQTAFQQAGDPLQATADLIVERHEARIRRSDAQKRTPILAELEAVWSKAPVTGASAASVVDA